MIYTARNSMAKSHRSIFKSSLFWLTIFALIGSLMFIFLGQHLGIESLQDILKRTLYGAVFFLGIIIAELLYLFLTKEEERESRRARREARREERKQLRAQKKLKKRAIVALKKKFYEALKIIKKSHIYKKRANYNYELPWYLVLGGETADQKAILKNSGLDFHINIEYRENEEDKESLFQWFFAEEGVFVTVPKSYVTLDKNSASHPIWLTFLKLFRSQRWRRPINGIIFTIDFKEISSHDETSLSEYAKVVREKMNEISKTFSSDIPIYMIVSGVEEVPAFQPFFSTLTPEEKREVLGITFEDSIEDVSVEHIGTKFALLLQKLENSTLGNMQNSWSKEERRDILFFLDEFQNFLVKVGHFSQKLFAKTRYYNPLMLRGIYFTDITHHTSSKYALTASGSTIVSGMFLPKVFERIILSESQLVKVHDDYRKKFTFFWILFLGLMAAAMGGIIYYWAQFVQDENHETKTIEKNYATYIKLQKGEKPKVTVTLKRSAKKVEPVMQIGKLGGSSGGDVSFGSGTARLTPFAKRELAKIVKHIGTLDPTTKIKIVGHTDSIGDEEVNLKLSKARANSVKDFFIKQGVDSERIVTEGAGEGSPVASNDTYEGRSLNRRVEIFAYGLERQDTEPSYEEEYVIQDNISDLPNILKMLDTLRSMYIESKHNISEEPWKPGFLRIYERNQYVQQLYRNGLETLLLPRVATLIEKELLSNLSSKLDTQNNLKAYLMLADEKHRDKEFLENYMQNKWGSDLSDAEIRRYNEHFRELLSAKFKPADLKHKSIFSARKKLISQAGAAGFIYKNLQANTKNQGIPDFQFFEVLDAYPNAFEGTDYRIPGFYTKKGYESVILAGAKAKIRKYMEKSWILGDEYANANDREVDRIYEKVLGLYFIDYRRHWAKALSQLKVPDYQSSAELSGQLELLSSGVSPVTLVLRAFKENTYLLTPKEKADLAMKKKRELGVTGAEIAGNLGSKFDRLQRLGTKGMQEFASDRMVYDLRTIFKPYHELLDERGKPSRKFQIVLRHVEKVYQQMLEVDTSSDPKQTAFDIVSKKSTSSHKTFALKSNLLPQKILTWYNKALNASWTYLVSLVDGQVDKTYNDEIWTFYTEKIEDRFPINLKSSQDIDLDDFKVFFKKDGLLDKFYGKYVSPFVSVDFKTGKYKQKVIDGSKVKIDKRMVASMVNAKKIQKLFFEAGSGELKLKASIKPIRLSANVASMDIIYGDQDIIYEHGPIQSREFVWPDKYPDSIAKFTFYDTQGNRVVKIRGEGSWALLRLFAKLHRTIFSQKTMNIGYKKGGYSGSFSVKGDMVKVYDKLSPLRSFKLPRK